MKDVKFRAWDGKHKEMVYSDKEDCFYVNAKGVMFMHGNSLSGYIKDYDTMQYIGIKDIDGKDIYECDVITLHNYNCTTHYDKWNYEVYYNCNEARYKLRNNQDYPNYIDMDTTANTDFAIVGNIYENPELLKERR